MKTINITIQGIAPLLQHRYRFTDELEAATKKKSGKRDYSDEWKASLYYDAKLGIYQPAEHIEGAMIKAAGSFQIVGKGKKTYRDLFKSAVFVTPVAIPHGIKGDIEKLVSSGKLSIDRRLVRVNNAGIERLRPMLKTWSLGFNIEIHDEQLSPDVIKQVLEHAGRYVGIGDFRPKFGRFTITAFK